MADLSSLLNPAPSTGPVNHELGALHQKPDHATPKPSRLPPVEIGTPSVQPSVKSPLDTLADAATSSAPILSPTNPKFFGNIGAYNHSAPPSTSRPSSSHFSPPPLSYDQQHAPVPTSPTFSPGLQQYHHPTSSEIRARRASAAAETAADSLPPLRRSLPNDSFQTSERTGTQSHHEDPTTSSFPALDGTSFINQDQAMKDHVEDAPVTSHIKQPSPGPSLTAEETILPTSQSDQTEVKAETTEPAPDITATVSQPLAHPNEASTEPKENIDLATPTENSKGKSSPAPAVGAAQSAMPKPKATPNRKRPAPKKGTASAVKPAAKKRKFDTSETIKTSSPLARVASPASSRASKTPAPKKGKHESVTPQRSSSLAAEDDDEDDDGVFCICRKPDDHTWMIACDGPCEDWFHGRCVDMTEKDGDLIEKYFCPNCTEAGDGETLWKRMCRLDGCNRPARVSDRSKYCSDEHGAEFMRLLALEPEQRMGAKKNTGTLSTTPAPKKGRKTNNSYQDIAMGDVLETALSIIESDQNSTPKEGEQDNTNETQAQARDGVLRPTELKALVTDVKDISEFRKLGEAPLSPPPTAAPNHDDDNNYIGPEDPTAPSPPNKQSQHNIPYSPLESSLLATLTTKKDELRTRKKTLDDRETLLTLVRERAKLVLDELKKKEKINYDICGFDNRLVWTDEEFDIWRASPDGIATLENRKLGPPTPLPIPENLAPHLRQQSQSDANNANGQINGVAITAGAKAEEEFVAGACQKKRCERHKHWVKLQQTEIAFAKDEARQAIRKVESEEKEVRERAM
ncbi:MAG: hypothetical protein Q9218_007688, partial [Villophora microphyllina]